MMSAFAIFLQVKPEDLLDTHTVIKQYVYLVAKSDDGHFHFQLLSYRDGMVFIQTDKPIYTPRQSGKNSTPNKALYNLRFSLALSNLLGQSDKLQTKYVH